MLLDLFIPFHLRHPLEPLLIAAAVSVPVLFAVLTALAHAPAGRRGVAVRVAAGVVMGASVYLTTMMLVTNWTDRALADVVSDARNLRYLVLGVALALPVTMARRAHARVFFGVVLGITPALTTLLVTPDDAVTPRVLAETLALLLATGLVMGLAMWVGHGLSHINRAGAALFATATFTTTLSAMPAILGAPGTVWRISTGIVTPWATIAVTAITLFLALAAALEHRRLAAVTLRERALVRSQNRLGDLVRASFEGLVVHREGVFGDCNERFAAMAGLKEGERSGPLERLFRDVAPFEAADGEAHETGLARVDGSTLPVEVMSQRLADGRTVTAVRDLSERHRRDREIRRLARHDGLTGLLNRAAFREIVTAQIAAGAPGALVAVDLDRFKPVNDTHGHGAGDAVLEVLAGRFSRALRDGDVLARLGGDEFALYLAGIADADRIARLCGRIVAAAAEPVEVERDRTTVRVQVGASVGYALQPDHGTTFDELLGHADLALYRAKEEGRGRAAAFRPEQRERALLRARMLHDLRDAVRNGAIDVAYQSVMAVRSGAPAGLEALARWTHPEHGAVPPSTFIPLAVESGAIHDLGRHVLDHACRTARETGLRVSVNASVAEMEGDYAAGVGAALRQAGLAPHMLEVEVTEAVLLPGHEAALTTLAALDAMGVGVVLDDFGAGHSALCSLARHPFSAIKLDRAFLASMNAGDAPDLVRAVVQIARVQRLRVTAEGVESHRQLAMLTQAGLDEVQGFLFGRPGPVTAARRVA